MAGHNLATALHPLPARLTRLTHTYCLGCSACSARRWLDLPDSATFDIVLLHYGSASPPPACLACAAVLPIAGPKWHLLWQATRLPVWRTLIAGKRAVMFADDDLGMDTCSINRRG